MNGSLKSLLLRLLTLLAGLACLLAAWFLMQSGLNSLSEARQLDRLPLSPIAALVAGPYAVSGQVTAAQGELTAPYSNRQVVYVRYLLEEEYRDSEGRTKTRTLDAGQRHVDFTLTDASSSVSVAPSRETEWQLERTYNQRRGNRIYSEWTLAQADWVNVVARYDAARQRLILSGTADYNLPAVVAAGALESVGGGRLFRAAMAISAAAGLSALAVALLLIGLGVHRFWVFVALVATLTMGQLLMQGAVRLSAEWQSVTRLVEARLSAVDQQQLTPAVRLDRQALDVQIARQTQGWLDRWMYRTHTAALLQAGQTGADAATPEQWLRPGSRYNRPTLSWLLVAGALGLSAVLFVAGIRRVKLKRLIEHLPTCRTTGLSYGVSELKGTVQLPDTEAPLKSPLRQRNCVAYDYHVQERRGSGKNAKWVTVSRDRTRQPFLLKDEAGKAWIYPDGADLEYSDSYSERRGAQRHTERWLSPVTELYCIGFAGLDDQQPDRLALQKGEDAPFLISVRSEDALMRAKAARGFLFTALSLGLWLFAATALMALDGQFSPDNLVLVALTVPLFLLTYTAVLHYNSLVFLRNRVKRARANIDTVLQKRHDLWPQLEQAVKAYLGHERQLMTDIGRLRSQPLPAESDTAAVGHRMQQEVQVGRQLLAAVEGYPDLKGQEVVQTCMAILTATEDHLALLRNGHTDAAQVYNTQIQVFPDVILARLFRFSPVPYLGA
ncbi:MAG: LemA family protein [Marinobacter sp.]|nr:LemA family protein [Marinobacter sp.]